jgi:hypothetical protein
MTTSRHWQSWEKDRYWEHKHDWWRKGRTIIVVKWQDWDRREAKEDKRERKRTAGKPGR